MKFSLNYLIVILMGLFLYNFFIKNSAEADAKKSYENYEKGSAIFIDVREEDEVKEGMIQGVHWIPLSRLEADKSNEIEKIKKVPLDKQIFLYCRSGNRAGIVQKYLKEAGITSVNMGGFSSLKSEGLPIQPGPK